MQLGMIGLGRMGSNMVQRLLKAGHQCVVYDSHPQAMQELVAKGAAASANLQEFAKKLTTPRAVWMMVPAGAVDSVLESLVSVLAPGDIVIDGGNSYYHRRHSPRRRARSQRPPLRRFGTSGGVWGLERGYCLMIGGEAAIVQHLDPIFKSLAPGVGDIAAHAGSRPAAAPRLKRLSALRARPAPATSSKWCTTASSTA